jgi:Uncharacterized homolog of phage Mu protein gp47
MYEDITYEILLERMLERIPNDIDKREGSIIYDALAPAAIELQNLYIALDVIMNETFADTANRENLIKRCYERGISPEGSTNAIAKGVFNIDISVGTRFSYELLNFIVLEKIEDCTYKLKCETAGTEGNIRTGSLIPINSISGLTRAEIVELLVPGENEEGTEMLRTRYMASLETQAFGGNVADYKQKINQLNGVGGVKVYPTWNGGGTVKLVIINSIWEKPSEVLIGDLQGEIDPLEEQGKGIGLAPVGHTVTIIPVEELLVNITMSLVLQAGFKWEDVVEDIHSSVEKYFKEINSQWANEENIAIRISQIESRVLDLPYIIDVADTALNGTERNIILEANQIAKRGDIVGTTAYKLSS